jgi:hypothetical protein
MNTGAVYVVIASSRYRSRLREHRSSIGSYLGFSSGRSSTAQGLFPFHFINQFYLFFLSFFVLVFCFDVFQIARCIEFGARVRAAANQQVTFKINSFFFPPKSIDFFKPISLSHWLQVDAATALSPLIVDAESHDDSKIAEFQEAHASSDLRLGLWVRATPAAQQGTRLKPIVFKELGISLELPKTLATLSSGNQFTTLALRVIHLLNDPFSILNQGSYLSLGGVVMLQFLGVLPPPLYIREWTVKEVTPQSQTLQLKPYPGPPDSGGTVQTIRISYSLPKNLLLQAENLQLAVFEDNEWKIDPLTITDAKYTNNTTAPAGTTTGASANERTISFLLMANRLAPMALVQQRALDFPYQKWAIIPLRFLICA